ncbi:MAG: ATP synthase subunit I [Burkholderiaceae bacterium]|jgi:ATP synthase protein I
MFRAIVHQILSVIILALGCLATQRWEVAISALIGGTCIVLPNLMFALRLSASKGRSPGSYPTVFFVGELVKLLATTGLMATAALYVLWLVWPAMIAGIVLAANAPWLMPMLLHRKAGSGR